jgi:hypothetical protein
MVDEQFERVATARLKRKTVAVKAETRRQGSTFRYARGTTYLKLVLKLERSEAALRERDHEGCTVAVLQIEDEVVFTVRLRPGNLNYNPYSDGCSKGMKGPTRCLSSRVFLPKPGPRHKARPWR